MSIDSMRREPSWFTLMLVAFITLIVGLHLFGRTSDAHSDPIPVEVSTLANLVQFSASTYTVVEDCTTLTITVVRSGDTSQAATVSYATSDATATGRRDYITAIDQLAFAAGESSKSFDILINEDSYVEGIETLNIALSSGVGTSLGAPATATVQIIDDATEPSQNTVDDAAAFVCQHYHDFLNRQPDPAGLGFWTDNITSCVSDQQCIEVKRINVSAAFFLSIEFQETGYLVERIYRVAYGDAIGTSTFNGSHQLPVPIIRLNEFLADSHKIAKGLIVGQLGWEQTLETNKQAFTSEFVQRSRFTDALPVLMTAEQFVDKLNSNAGNPLLGGERDQLVSELTNAVKTRAQVLRAVAEHPTLHRAEFNRAFVLMQYLGYMRRNPNDSQDTDYTGYDFWLTKLNQFSGNFANAEMVKAFILSGEYRDRFGGATVPVAGAFKVIPTQLSLAVNDDENLLALNAPGAITWTSSNPAVVTVNTFGQLKALTKGTALITAGSGTFVASSTIKVYQVTGANPDPTTESLIAAALLQNSITAEQDLIYRVFALFGDERLPAAFEGAPSRGPHHLLLRELGARINSLSQSAQDVLRPFLRPPIYADSWYAKRLGLTAQAQSAASAQTDGIRKTSTDTTINCDVERLPQFYGRVITAHFNIYYLKIGNETQNAAAASVVASLIEDVYRSETDLLDRFPMSDATQKCNGGDGEYDIYLGSFALGGLGAWTTAYPPAAGQNPCANLPSFMMLNSFSVEFLFLGSSPQQSEHLRLLVKSILAHEFLHALQFAMPRQASCEDTKWFDEATAQWAMDHVVSTIPPGVAGEFGLEDGLEKTAPNLRKTGSVLADYLYSGHMVSLEKPGAAPKLNGYSDYLFFQFLARKQSPDKIKQIFNAMASGQNSVESVAAAVDMKSVWPDFAASLWIGKTEQVLDYWSTADEYEFGLSAIYSQVATNFVIPKPLKDKLKTLEIDQRAQPRATFKLFDNALQTSSGSYEFQPRSVFYEHLKFTDATVHSVYLSNPIAILPNQEFMKVQALKKIGGQWQAIEDWTSVSAKQFCLDKKNERLEELLLIVSNSETNRATELPYTIPGIFPFQISTSNVGCWKWQGTATTVVTGTVPFPVETTGRGANVTFSVTSVLPGRLIFDTTAGVISGMANSTQGQCTITLQGTDKTASATPPPDGTIDVNLDLDLGFGGIGDPPPNRKFLALQGLSTLLTLSTMVCPTFTQQATGDQSWDWLRVDDPMLYQVSSDGQTIEGVFTSNPIGAVIRSTWRFNALREP